MSNKEPETSLADTCPPVSNVTFSQNVQKSPKMASPKSSIKKLKYYLRKSGNISQKPAPSGQKTEGDTKKKRVNFDKYQIYQLSGNIVVSTLPEQDLKPESTDQDNIATFYVDQDYSEEVPALVDSVSHTVESPEVAHPDAIPIDLVELPSEEHEDHTHHCLGYEVHPVGSTSSSILSLAQIAKTQHVGDYKYLGDSDARKSGSTTGQYSPNLEPPGVPGSQNVNFSGKDRKSNFQSISKMGLHKVCTAPAVLPCITVMPATPEVFELKHKLINTATGLEFVSNDSNVYSLPLPDDVVNPSSPTNNTPTKLSSSPAKSGIPFSGSTMVRRSSESDLSTPPKGISIRHFI